MNSTAKKIKNYPAIINLKVDKNSLSADMSDGRSVSIPIAWFPRLSQATQKELKYFEISPSGYGIHWPELDEDISVKAFLD